MIRNFFKSVGSAMRSGAFKSRKALAVALAVGSVAVASQQSRATDVALETSTALSSDFANGVYPYINNIVPIALAVFGLALGVMLLMHWTRKAAH